MVIIFCDFLMFYQISFSLQLKPSGIISNKHGICELPHELLNNLKPKLLGNQEISEKPRNARGLLPSTQPYYQSNIFSILGNALEKRN